jgi:hypothetical protein
VKGWFGSDAPQASPAGVPARPVPSLPAVPAGRGGARSFTDNSQTKIEINQQPGENSRDLARRIAEEQERQRKARQRGALYDGAVAQ